MHPLSDQSPTEKRPHCPLFFSALSLHCSKVMGFPMNQELTSSPVPELSAEALKISAPFLPNLRANLRVPLADEGPSPILRGEGVVPFAARNELRRSPVFPWLTALQKCAGMVLVSGAWLAFLWGLAQLILAAVHNQQGELGLGIDSTLNGAKSCLASFVMAAAGVPQWVMANRKLTLG